MQINLGDLSQIIASTHWENSTIGTTFNYIDLNCDQQVDLSDLSKIISEDYWEFPN